MLLKVNLCQVTANREHWTFDKVPHEVADQNPVVFAGEQHVEEKVHGGEGWIRKL